MLVMPKMHTASSREVWTYEAEGWPLGVLTGMPDHEGMRLEHVIVFPGAPTSTLLKMLREAWAVARTQYPWVVFHLPHGFPMATRLARLADSLSCIEYGRDNDNTYYVRYR